MTSWQIVWRTLCVVLATALAVLAVIQVGYFARIQHLASHDPETTAFMNDRRALLAAGGTGVELRHRWIAYDDISPNLIRAVIAAEDANFVEHRGIDWEAVFDAMDRNRAEGRVVRGGSTISQQLAKNLFLSERQSYPRKLQEAVLTVMIERSMDKRRILELYLNVIEWGDGVFGAEAAARHYFGISAADLGPWQASVMAARIPRPRYYDHNGYTPFLLRRSRSIQRWIPMVQVP